MSETNEKTISEDDFIVSPLLSAQSADGSSALKDFMISFTGEKLQPENDEVSIDMLAQVLAMEFPEFAYAYAEENFIRGYELGLEDATKLFEKETAGAEREE